MTGGPNEVWSYGPQALEIITAVMEMRERLRPYLHEQLDRASTDGLPAMRPLFLDFPDDKQAWLVEDEMMFGPDSWSRPCLKTEPADARYICPQAHRGRTRGAAASTQAVRCR